MKLVEGGASGEVAGERQLEDDGREAGEHRTRSLAQHTLDCYILGPLNANYLPEDMLHSKMAKMPGHLGTRGCGPVVRL